MDKYPKARDMSWPTQYNLRWFTRAVRLYETRKKERLVTRRVKASATRVGFWAVP
jgi:hypothetical protein